MCYFRQLKQNVLLTWCRRANDQHFETTAEVTLGSVFKLKLLLHGLAGRRTDNVSWPVAIYVKVVDRVVFWNSLGTNLRMG
jgi:hypothetical protein